MPKNYQICQYDLPFAIGGASSRSRVTSERRASASPACTSKRTPASRSTSAAAVGSPTPTTRSRTSTGPGTPLVEIVSEPDIHSAEEARVFVTELRALCSSRSDVSDVRMEEGSMRVDANVSVRRKGEKEFGAKVEVKNMNSIRSVGSRARVRREASAASARCRGDTGPGDPALRREDGNDVVAADEGVRVRLPLLPRARPGAVRAAGETGSSRSARLLPEFPAGAACTFRESSLGVTRDRSRDPRRLHRPSPTGSRRRSRPTAAKPRRSSTGSSPTCYGLLNEAEIELTDSKVSPRRARGAREARRRRARSPASRRRPCWARCSKPGRTRQRSPTTRDWSRSQRHGAIEGVIDEVDRRERRGAPTKCEPGSMNTARLPRRTGDEEDRGPGQPRSRQRDSCARSSASS